jgi:hypothetical protein
MTFVDVFGGRLTALIAAVALAYFVIALAPVWWPALHARRRTPRLPRPFLFVGTAAALVYGVSTFIMLAILLPMSAVRIFLVPELDQAGVGYAMPLGHVSNLFYEHGWIMIVPMELLLTWHVTRRLAGRWAHICAQPAANASV